MMEELKKYDSKFLVKDIVKEQNKFQYSTGYFLNQGEKIVRGTDQ